MKKKIKRPPQTHFKLREDKVEVSLEYIGEGYNGDYNPQDTSDKPLLRLDVCVHKSIKNDSAEDGGNAWKYMLDSSYCTCLPAEDKITARKALRHIMKKVKKPCLNGQSIKRICAELSWLSPSDFQKKTK